MSLPIYRISVKDPKEVNGAFLGKYREVAIALVDEPAIEENFIFFNKEQVNMTFNDEKMMIKGPAIIPNKKIYRNDSLGERFVFFTQDDIYKFVELFMSKSNNKFNQYHTDSYIKANVIESYFASEPNEFDVPAGSWIVSAKINDPVIWEKVKNGEFKGLSVEGIFSNELIEFAQQFKEEKTNESMSDLKEKLINAINNVLFDEKPEEVLETETGKVEEFEMVESSEVVSKVEEKIDAVESAVESAPQEALTVENIKSMLEELKASILEDFNSRMANVEEQMSKVDEKVIEFSKQPISQSVIVEEVANPKTNNSNKAAEYFRK